ncbi:MAG: glycoside hydrolase family 32 protein [Actinomycetota bacterium]|nr:glycoside hydrolase family 32 protein [Actinomycetota bacterium]
MNDPHGLTWHEGEYHLFFQYVPGSTEWAVGCHWGHATSVDLVSWRERGIALAPGHTDDGVWSGSLVVDDAGRARIFYTSVREPNVSIGRIRTATPSTADWSTWRKGAVVATAPDDGRVAVFRDPYVFRDGSGWRMLVGAGLADGRGAVLSVNSPDLVSWTHDGLLAQPPAVAGSLWTGTVWECPQLVEVDGAHVLLVSVWAHDVLHYVAYAVGAYLDGQFQPGAWRRLTFGPSHYAGSLFRDELGRPGLVCWLREIGTLTGEPWRGALSIPYLLSLDGDVLVAAPHPSVMAAVEVRRAPDSARAPATLPVGPTLLPWRPRVGEELRLHAAAGVAVRLRSDRESVLVDLGEPYGVAELPLGAGEVTVLIDGPVLELRTDRGLLAAPVPALCAVSVGPASGMVLASASPSSISFAQTFDKK